MDWSPPMTMSSGSFISVEVQPLKVQLLGLAPSVYSVIEVASLITSTVCQVLPPSFSSGTADTTVQPQREATELDSSVCK